MQALNRETLSIAELDEYISETLSESVYAPMPSKPFSPVHFKLNFGAMASEDTLVNIYSHAVDKRIYRGPYQKEFTILAGEELLGANYGDGGDNFTVNIIQKSTRKVGTGVIESIQPWQANKTVHITLLPFRELNAIGLPVTFKVDVE